MRKKLKRVITIVLILILLLVIFNNIFWKKYVAGTKAMASTIKVNEAVLGYRWSYIGENPKRKDIIVFKEPVQNKVLYIKRLMGLPGEIVEIDKQRLFIDGKQISDRRCSNQGEMGYNQWIVPKKGDHLTIVPAEDYSKGFRDRGLDIAEIQKYLTSKPGALTEAMPNVSFYINGKKTGMVLDYIHDEKVVEKLLKGKTVEVIIPEDYYFVIGDNTDYSFDSRFWGFVAKSRIESKIVKKIISPFKNEEVL